MIRRRQSVMGRIVSLVCVILALGARTTAQDSSGLVRETNSDPTMFASLGLGERLIADRWNLVRVTVQPGSTPVSGAIVVSSGLSTVTLTRSSAAFISVPGIATRVDQVVPLPRNVWFQQDLWIHVAMVDADGRTLQVLKFDDTGSSTSMEIPPVQGDQGKLVVCVGRSSLQGLGRLWSDPGVQRGQVQLAEDDYEQWSGVVVVGLEEDSLPSHPTGLDAVDAVVLSTGVMHRLGDRSAEILRDWLLRGGRLVLVGPTQGRDLAWWSMDGVFETSGDAAVDTRITPEGRARGWAMSAAPMPLEFPLAGPPLSVLIAQGPVGLGCATYLGADPERWEGFDAERIWQAVLSESFAAPLSTSEYSYFSAQGASDQLPSLLDSMVESMPSPGFTPMVLIVIFTVLVGLLLGPIDWWWLKRKRLGHWAWATAIAWISIASVAAYAWPNIVRAGRSQLRRVAVVDSVMSHDGSVATAWKTGVTCVLAASSGTRTFDGLAPRTAWRRVRTFESTMQRPAVVYTDQSVVAEPGPIGMDIWTINSFRDDAPENDAPTAVVVHDGAWLEVEVRGAPAGEIVDGQVSVPDRTLDVTFDRGSDGVLRARVRKDAEAAMELVPNNPETNSNSFDAMRFVRALSTRRDAAGLTISGVTDREDSMFRAVKTGAWALVSFRVEGLESDVTLKEPADTQMIVTYRTLVPLEKKAE